MEKKYHVTNAEWIALTSALEATPDISMRSLTVKAGRLVASCKRYAREVIELEGKLLKKCPELDK
jgi:hypothetical protein